MNYEFELYENIRYNNYILILCKGLCVQSNGILYSYNKAIWFYWIITENNFTNENYRINFLSVLKCNT